MKKLSIVFIGVALLALLLVGADRLNTSFLVRKVRVLQVGDSKQRVEYVLGSPASVFNPMTDARSNLAVALLSVSSETWAYGRYLDFHQPFHTEYPYFFPGDMLRFRIFKPDSDDIAIEFDSSGRVRNITTP
jgi:outer membrane protein assembly factor BamE (lipoprotein component of BamABCDE complex)